MVLFIILGLAVVIALCILGFLFYMLNKEGQKNESENVVPLTDPNQIKKELSAGPIEPPNPKFILKDSEIIPPFEPKVSLPTQPVVAPLEDDTYKKRAQELEDELQNISKKAEEQSNEAKQMIESLTQENEALKKQKENLDQAQQKLTEIQQEASGLKTENSNLQSQLETTNAKVHLLEEQMAAVQLQMGEEISRANATVSQLNREKEEILAAVPKPLPDPAVVAELEALKIEHVQLRQKYDDLESLHKKLSDLNAHLIEKNNQLQYDMVKSRAQSSGLERVSFNYKNQVEDFLKKINAAQVTNDHLAQVKGQLEGMVEEIKLQNEDLAKKDQLAQFELEKNRSRLANLERECEELKSRIQQKDQQV